MNISNYQYDQGDMKKEIKCLDSDRYTGDNLRDFSEFLNWWAPLRSLSPSLSFYFLSSQL